MNSDAISNNAALILDFKIGFSESLSFHISGFRVSFVPKDNNISDSLIHKICGNGIVVNVFEHLFRNIYETYFS